MNKARIADTAPCEVDLEEGKTYFFCTCGHSQTQPFCDGSHKETDTGLKSFAFTAEKTGKAWLCMCKRTGGQPFCDGSHSSLGEET